MRNKQRLIKITGVNLSDLNLKIEELNEQGYTIKQVMDYSLLKDNSFAVLLVEIL